MVKKGVVDYVRQQLAKGYSIANVRSALLQSGYSHKDIDEALNAVYNPTVRHIIHLSKGTIMTSILLVLIISGTIGFFYINPPKASSQLLDLNLEPVKMTAEAGQSITFVKELTNQGSAERYDVVIVQELIEPKSFKIVTEKTETRAIENFGSTTTEMHIPSDVPAGDYLLRAVVEYGGKRAVASLPVKITAPPEQETCFDNIQNQDETGIDCGGACSACEVLISECDDGNKCTNDRNIGNRCVFEPITPCCGNDICESNENCKIDCEFEPAETGRTIEEINELAKTQPTAALRECKRVEIPDLKDECISNIGKFHRDKSYCVEIAGARIKDICYSEIAKSTNDNKICDAITYDSRKDSCYMTFVLDNKDYSVCDKISNKALRQSCESLRQLHELNQLT